MAGVQDELAVLRARAFGPDADIAADPAAIARLRELEEALRRARETPPAEADPLDVFRSVAEEASPAPRAPAASPPPRPALPRRVRVAWALSLVVVAVVAVVVTLWLDPRAPHNDARLAATSEAVPSSLSAMAQGADIRAFEPYLGLGVYGGDGCLILAASTSQIWYGGCFGAGLPPIADVYVPPGGGASASPTTVELPEELTARHPDGAVLRFTLDGDRVLVDVGELPAARS